MAEAFQRLLTMSGPDALSLNEQAALGPVRARERSQLAHLVRHFLERFFNHETASPDGDAKGRLVLIAVAAGLPPFMVAIYLWPVYHPFIGWPPGQPAALLGTGESSLLFRDVFVCCDGPRDGIRVGPVLP
jgi:hypothetical protein